MSCEGCFGELKAQNEQRERVFQQAVREAQTSGKWFVIYQEPGTNQWTYIAADGAPGGLPNPRLVSPTSFMQNSNVR